MVKKYIPLVIVVFFSLFSTFSLFNQGFYPTHDGEYHVIRFYEFFKTLQSGIFYPRWAVDLNNGYGIPLFTYVYPLPNYIASFFHSFGISFIDAYKLQMIVASIIGAIFFYLWSKQYFNTHTAVATSIIYTFSPYRFVDIYIRGSIGEVWALALFPVFLWAVTAFLIKEQKRFFVISILSLSLVILSHNILAMMFFPFAIIYTIVAAFSFRIKRRNWRLLAGIFLFGLGVSAIFWVPAIFEKQYVTGLQVFSISSEAFPEFYQLLIPSWGTGFDVGALENQMSYQLGVVNIFAVLFAGIVSFLRIKTQYKGKFIILFFLFSFLLCFLLMLSFSAWLWGMIPFINFFQFPWRLLSLTILLSAFLGGAVSYVRGGKYIVVLLALLSVGITYAYIRPAYYHDRNDNYYINRSNFINGTNSPGNAFNTIWFTGMHKKESEKAKIVKGKGTIHTISLKPTKYDFKVEAKDNVRIQVNTAYFPGWKVISQHGNVSLWQENGIIAFNLPKGRHMVTVALHVTRLQLLAEIISVLSLFSLLYFVRIIR